VEELIHHEEACTSDCVSLMITCLFKQRDYFFFCRWQSTLSCWDLFKPPALKKSCMFCLKITLREGVTWRVMYHTKSLQILLLAMDPEL